MRDRKRSKADKKLDESLKNLSVKQRSEALAARKEQRKWRLYGVLTVVVILLIAALLFWDHGFIQQRATALTIGEKNYTVADLDYYYYSQYNMMYSYASYYGIDTSVSLKEQEAYDGTTWYDYLMDSAVSSLTEISILAQEGEKAGYTISDEGQQNIDDTMSDMAETAKENNITKAYYLHRMFGRFMTEKRFEKIVTEYYYAYDYQTAKTDGFEISDDEIDDYYEENKDTLDTYEYVCYAVDATPTTEQDEDGNDIALTAADYAEAEQAASDNAESLKAVLEEGDADTAALLASNMSNVTDYSDVSPSSFASYTFGEWLQDASRTANEVTTLTDTTTVTLESEDPADSGDSSAESSAVDPADTGTSSADSSAAEDTTEELEVTSTIYVVQFLDRYRDDYYAGSFHSIFVSAEADDDGNYDFDTAEEQANALLATFEANGGTEAAFVALDNSDEEEDETEDTDESEDTADASGSASAKEEEEPTYTVTDQTSVAKGSATTVLDEWLYGSDHETGDTAVLKDETSSGYYVVYFVGYDELYQWQSTAKSALQSDAYDEWYSDVSEDYETSQTWFYTQAG